MLQAVLLEQCLLPGCIFQRLTFTKKNIIATRLEVFKFRKGIININIYHFIVGRNRENRQHCALRLRISRDFWQHMLQKTVAAVTSQLELLLVEVIEKWDEGKIQVRFR